MSTHFWVHFFGSSGEDWVVGKPETPDGVPIEYDTFTRSDRYPNLPFVRGRVVQDGERTDVTFLESFVLVVNQRAKELFERNCLGVMDLHLFEIDGEDAPYWIADFYQIIDCYECWKSGAKLIGPSLWSPEPVFYLGERTLLLRSRVGPRSVAFRPRGLNELVFHKKLKEIIEQANLTGIWFTPVEFASTGFTWHDQGWIPAFRRWWMRIRAM